MTLDIRGSLKNTRINNNPYVVFDELLSNAIDSYLIRKNQEPTLQGLEASFVIEFFPKVIDANKLVFRLTCSDNGAGFGDEQVKAFVTKDTSYKDDLAIEGIGKCRGSGRIQFLHYFAKVDVDSVYADGKQIKRRTLKIDDSAVKEIDEQSFGISAAPGEEVKTTLVLDVIKPDIYAKFFDDHDLRDEYSADSLKTYVMVNFLQRLVSLKTTLGKFTIKFKTVYNGHQEETALTPDNLPQITATKTVAIPYKDATGKETASTETFTLSHYKLSKATQKMKRNLVALCAKSSAVKVITSKYLKTKALENNDISGFYHLVLIESDYLDEHVNMQRDGFDIPDNSQQSDLFLKNLIPMDQIYDTIDEPVRDMLAPPNWDKEAIVRNVSAKYGISSDMISEAKVRIHYGHNEEYVVKRVLSAYQEQIIKDTSDIFDIKVELEKTDPTSPQFRDKINELAWKYTSSLKSIDKANLSQLVVRRAAILKILSLAVKKGLEVQAEDESKRRCDEKMIHNVFFPMGKDNKETGDHDIWLLNEEYQYFSYIASDKPLSKIQWDENSMLFESDIDEKMQELMKKNYGDNCAKRPDIAIFSKEGSLIIIEFKAPGINLDEHTGDLMEYAQLLMAKSQGKIKKVYGYLIGDQINANRIRGYTLFPNGKGWFGTEEIKDHASGTRLGEMYSEILFYEDLVDKAAQRLEVYKTRLGIDWSPELATS
jgi:hypothetical protein